MILGSDYTLSPTLEFEETYAPYGLISISATCPSFDPVVAEEFLSFRPDYVQNEQAKLAERDLAYEYGRCVFYDKISLEKCNRMEPDGLRLYEKYYGDGSWVVEDDPIPAH